MSTRIVVAGTDTDIGKVISRAAIRQCIIGIGKGIAITRGDDGGHSTIVRAFINPDIGLLPGSGIGDGHGDSWFARMLGRHAHIHPRNHKVQDSRTTMRNVKTPGPHGFHKIGFGQRRAQYYKP